MIRRTLRLALLISWTSALFGQYNPTWTEPFPPHRIIDNIYYVGSKGLASYLIVTPQGNILINSSLEQSVPLIKRSIEQLGFKFSDTKILLVSHAHWDHNAGSATVKELTGAKYFVMAPDVPVTEDGGKSDFHYGNQPSSLYKPAKVDRALHDGDEVKLGGTVLTARLTAGHTKGCTTWTMKARENGKIYDVVIVGSLSVNEGFKLVNNPKYPAIADDYEHSIRLLKSLHCDIFLGAHGDYYGMEGKYARIGQSGPNVFIDPDGYQKYIVNRERAFLKELERQKK